MPTSIVDALIVQLAASCGEARDLAGLQRAPMPRSIGHFLAAHLQGRLLEEWSLCCAPRSGWFDAEDPRVVEARRELQEAIINSGRFPETVWPTALRDATTHVISYLARPVKSLCGFLFAEDADTVDADTMLFRLDHFCDYLYLLDTVRTCVKENSVHRTDVAAALTQADRKFAVRCDTDDWISLLKPVYTLADQAGAGVSPSLLSTFFADKGIVSVADRLKRYMEPLDENSLRRELTPEIPSVPLWQQFHQHTPAPLWQQFHTGKSTEDVMELEQEVLGEAAALHGKTFMRTIFGEDRKIYIEVLKRLQAAPTWIEAAVIITRDVFHTVDVNVYGGEVQLFTEAVRQRYDRPLHANSMKDDAA